MWGLAAIRRKFSRSQKIQRATTVAVEALEGRMLLSAAPGGWAAIKMRPVAGTLILKGTGRNDTMSVGVSSQGPDLIDATVNGTTYTFNKADVNKILFKGGNGKDYMFVDETHGVLHIGVEMRGGEGSDRMIGGSNDDRLMGHNGNDYISGGGGNDWINGQGGNDRLWGGLGNDYMKGGAHHDWLVGGFGDDLIFGDGGNDLLDTTEGNDTFYGGLGTNEVNTPMARGLTTMISRPTADYNRPNLGPTTLISTPTGLSVNDIRTAYEFGDLSDPFTLQGAGMAVAVVIAFDIPTAEQDLQTFSEFYGLPYDDDPVTGGTLETIFASGQRPIRDPSGTFGWDGEANLDIQWIHAVAPLAKIYLVEADSNSPSDIDLAIRVAAQTLVQRHGGGVVNMSLGQYVDVGGEIGADATEAIFRNPLFDRVSFVAASGDAGARPAYPGTSPNVLSVGGTRLTVDANGNYVSETTWTDSSGGYSSIFGQPVYQIGVTANGLPLNENRAAPDVAIVGDPASGVSVYNSFPIGDVDGDGTLDTGWATVGGTSAGAPMWSGLIAVANELRANNGLNTIGDGVTAKVYALGSLNQDLYFNDINTGQIGPDLPNSSAVFQAFDGYDIASGWGTPHAQQVISGLADGTIAGAQIRGFRWSGTYREAILQYPGGVSSSLFADFRGTGEARVTSNAVQLVLSIEQQYFGRLLQITLPIMTLDANNEFRGSGVVSVEGPITVSNARVAVAGRVFVDENGITQVRGSWDMVNPFSGQLPIDGFEETFKGSFRTDY